MLNIALPRKIGAEEIDPVFLKDVIVEGQSEENVFDLSQKVFGSITRRPSSIAPISNIINFDFSNVYFSQPSGITILSNLIHWLRQRGVTVNYSGANPSFEALKFLDDSNFFEICFNQRINPNSSSRPTTKPLKLIDRAHSHDWAALEVVPWLKRITSINAPSLVALSVCLKELINNIGDHSSEQIGSTFAQFYPKNKNVVISISDFGVGIPANIKKFLETRESNNDVSDSWCIVKACERGFSTQSSIGNKGVGLAYLIETVVNAYGGKVIILSGKAKVMMLPQHSPIQIQNSWFYPGCLIDIHIPTDKIPIITDEEDEFEW